MDARKYEPYTIRLKSGKIASIEADGHIINKFSPPASSNGQLKLYVIKSGAEVIYAGITSQSLRARLRWGFHANGEQGYYGYKWKNLNIVEMLVWYFPGAKLSSIEPVEAELAYLVRHRTGNWPKYQMEIHFHQSSKRDKELAEAIYTECMKY